MKTLLYLQALPLWFALLFLSVQALAAQLTVQINGSNISCFDAADGQATATASGGLPPYKYIWSNNATSETIFQLGPGVYSVTVVDANQATVTALVTIQQPPQLLVFAFASAAICDVAPDGTASCVPSGGTPPYTYLWSNDSTSAQLLGLTGGSYTVTVTDAHECTFSTSCVVDAWHEGLWISSNDQPANCDNTGGAIHLAVMSGTPPYQYVWNTGATTADLSNLGAGAYSASVSDFNGCAHSVTILIQRELEMSTLSTVATCGYADGRAGINALSGAPPYTYQWSNGATTQIIESLAEGVYTVSVVDLNGCAGSKEAYVPSDAGTPISLQFLNPKCFNETATFTIPNTPALYPELHWDLYDTLDQIISGQGTNTIEVLWHSTGQKTVTMTYGHNGIFCGGSGFLLTVAVCAGVSDLSLNDVMVSPNPFSDGLNIQFMEALPANTVLSLTDISGKLLTLKSLENPSIVLPTAALPAGFYLLKLKTPGAERHWKLVKN